MNSNQINDNAAQLKKRIMRRVCAIWFFRRIVPGMFVFPLFVFFAAYEISREFFVERIFENFTQAVSGAPSSPLALWGFAADGLRSASIIALFVISLSLAFGAFACFHIVRNMREVFSGRRGRNFFADAAL